MKLSDYQGWFQSGIKSSKTAVFPQRRPLSPRLRGGRGHHLLQDGPGGHGQGGACARLRARQLVLAPGLISTVSSALRQGPAPLRAGPLRLMRRRWSGAITRPPTTPRSSSPPHASARPTPSRSISSRPDASWTSSPGWRHLQPLRGHCPHVSIRHADKDPGCSSGLGARVRRLVGLLTSRARPSTTRPRSGSGARARGRGDQRSAAPITCPTSSHGHDRQFRMAYPRAGEFFALKKRWTRPTSSATSSGTATSPRPRPPPTRRPAQAPDPRAGYKRGEDQPSLTLPEWYIFYSATSRPSISPEPCPPPSLFQVHRAILAPLRPGLPGHPRGVPANPGYHVMIGMIGLSVTAEYALKGFLRRARSGA